MSLQPSAISAPPSANCPLSLLLLCPVYSAGWGWGTSEESFIHALHTVEEALYDVLQVVLCNIDVHSKSQPEVCLLFHWRICMYGEHSCGPWGTLEHGSVNQLLFVSAMHRRFLEQPRQKHYVVSAFIGFVSSRCLAQLIWLMMCEQEASQLLLIKHPLLLHKEARPPFTSPFSPTKPKPSLSFQLHSDTHTE